MEQTWQQRLTEEANRSKGATEEKALMDVQRKSKPHFWNLNEDPALTDMIIHFIKSGDSRVGNSKAQPPADIQLNGLRYYLFLP